MSAAEAARQESWLTPILVDYSSRDGSTLMMRLLHSSPQIAVEGPYPYERKYFAYLVRWARLLDRADWSEEEWSSDDLGSLTQESLRAMLGPPPWNPRRAFESGTDGEPLSAVCLRFAWRQFSRRAALSAGEGDPKRARAYTHYAEKHLNTQLVDLGELPPLRVIVLVRDPRDSFVSIREFNARRGDRSRPIGIDPSEDEAAWRARFIRRHRKRMRWIASLAEAGEHVIVRYEDLALDLEGVARRLEREFAVELDPEAVLADVELRETHATTESAEDSVGRWKESLAGAEATEFAAGLGDELRVLEFEV